MRDRGKVGEEECGHLPGRSRRGMARVPCSEGVSGTILGPQGDTRASLTQWEDETRGNLLFVVSCLGCDGASLRRAPGVLDSVRDHCLLPPACLPVVRLVGARGDFTVPWLSVYTPFDVEAMWGRAGVSPGR